MRLNAPTQTYWWVAIVLGVAGVVGNFVALPFVTAYAFWFVTVGLVVLALSTLLKGM